MLMLGDALAIMDRTDVTGRPIPFSITWCTLDRNRRSGGQIRHMKAAVRAGAAHNLQRARQVAIKPADGTGHNTPIHMRLLLRINGQFIQS